MDGSLSNSVEHADFLCQHWMSRAWYLHSCICAVLCPPHRGLQTIFWFGDICSPEHPLWYSCCLSLSSLLGLPCWPVPVTTGSWVFYGPSGNCWHSWRMMEAAVASASRHWDRWQRRVGVPGRGRSSRPTICRWAGSSQQWGPRGIWEVPVGSAGDHQDRMECWLPCLPPYH